MVILGVRVLCACLEVERSSLIAVGRWAWIAVGRWVGLVWVLDCV